MLEKIEQFVNSQIDQFSDNIKSTKEDHPLTTRNISELRGVFCEKWTQLFDSWVSSCSNYTVNLLLDEGFSATTEQTIVKSIKRQFSNDVDVVSRFFSSVKKKVFTIIGLFIFVLAEGVVLLYSIDDIVWKISITQFIIGFFCISYAGLLHCSRKENLVNTFSVFMKEYFSVATQKWSKLVDAEVVSHKSGGNVNGRSN